jgi:large subunit ribosomal protein L18
MIPQRKRNEIRQRVHSRIRAKVHGTAERPRLNVYRSLNHIYAQVIDDTTGRTLVAASSKDKSLAGSLSGKTKIERAESVGQLVADRAKAAGINQVVFDRGGYKYHGRVQALADAARKGGLTF